MFDKKELAREIGCYFGDYFEENHQFCIDNGEKVFRYDTVDVLLKDWVDTLVANHHDTHHFDEQGKEWDSWEKEIVFIYKDVIGKYPAGIRAVPVKDGIKWSCSIDVTIPGETSPHGKNLYLGTYDSIVDAIYARDGFKQIYDERNFKDLNHLSSIASAYRKHGKTKSQQESKRLAIALFHKALDFEKEHGITVLSPVKVMLDLHHEIKVSPSELYILANKLIDGIYRSDDPFLYGERIAAVQTIMENGFSGNYYLDNMSPDEAWGAGGKRYWCALCRNNYERGKYYQGPYHRNWAVVCCLCGTGSGKRKYRTGSWGYADYTDCASAFSVFGKQSFVKCESINPS